MNHRKSYNCAPKIILNEPHLQFKWLFMFPILPTFELDFHFPMLILKPHFELLKCNKFKCLVECEWSFNRSKPNMSHEIFKVHL